MDVVEVDDAVRRDTVVDCGELEFGDEATDGARDGGYDDRPDFGTLLALRRASKPSFILIRAADPLTTAQISVLLLTNLDVMAEDLQWWCHHHLRHSHLRSRRLPLSNRYRTHYARSSGDCSDRLRPDVRWWGRAG